MHGIIICFMVPGGSMGNSGGQIPSGGFDGSAGNESTDGNRAIMPDGGSFIVE